MQSIILPTDNILFRTDSYKVGHNPLYDEDVENVHSYTEARLGAIHDRILFNGMLPRIKRYLIGQVVTREKIEQAAILYAHHFGSEAVFNREGWEIILNEHGGRLPITIKALPEGTVVPIGNRIMDVKLTKDDKRLRWVPNYFETMLLRIWYPITVGTVSYHLKQAFLKFKEQTSMDDNVAFMLHDFGARGVTVDDAAAAGGCAHLINFLGTDTVEGMIHAMDYYNADPATLAFSVIATEHSIMTQRGKAGEESLMRDILTKNDTGIVAEVIDSYDADRFMYEYVVRAKDIILARKPNAIGLCKFVMRPDSLRSPQDTPEQQMLKYTTHLGQVFGYEINAKGYKVINSKVGLLWGDGIGPDGIIKICQYIVDAGYSVDHLVFGMGGGLLQKVNRDTERFATKCCRQKINGVWVDIQKDPLDKSKKSKTGDLKTVYMTNRCGEMEIQTINQHHPLYYDHADILVDYFIDGELKVNYTFDDVRRNSSKN